MAAALPDALRMRDLKYGDTPVEERLEVAEALRARGRRAEAILLFERLPDHRFLREEVPWAVANGRAFHLLSLRRIGVAVSPEDLRACAAAAETAGRLLDALQCLRAVGDEEGVRRVAARIEPALAAEPPELPGTTPDPGLAGPTHTA